MSRRAKRGPEGDVATLAMERYAAGDNSAFEQVYDLIAPRLYAYGLRQTREAARAEDLVQQTLLQMHRAKAAFVVGADVLPWAFAIARRLLIDGERHRQSERAHASVQRERDEDASPEGHGEDLMLAKHAAAKIQRAFENLPEHQRIAYQLVKDEGLSLSDAAQVLGTTVMAVKLRIHRAREWLLAAYNEPTRPPLRP